MKRGCISRARPGGGGSCACLSFLYMPSPSILGSIFLFAFSGGDFSPVVVLDVRSDPL